MKKLENLGKHWVFSFTCIDSLDMLMTKIPSISLEAFLEVVVFVFYHIAGSFSGHPVNPGSSSFASPFDNVFHLTFLAYVCVPFSSFTKVFNYQYLFIDLNPSKKILLLLFSVVNLHLLSRWKALEVMSSCPQELP